MADNILRRGLVADKSTLNPYCTPSELSTEKGGRGEELAALDTFNRNLVENERIESFLLPLFDGLGLGRLRD